MHRNIILHITCIRKDKILLFEKFTVNIMLVHAQLRNLRWTLRSVLWMTANWIFHYTELASQSAEHFILHFLRRAPSCVPRWWHPGPRGRWWTCGRWGRRLRHNEGWEGSRWGGRTERGWSRPHDVACRNEDPGKLIILVLLLARHKHAAWLVCVCVCVGGNWNCLATKAFVFMRQS